MDSGFCRKDGRGGTPRRGRIPAFAGKTGVGHRGGDGFRLSPERREGPSGRGRRFRLSPERRRGPSGRGRGFRLSPERRRGPSGRGRGFRLSPERREGWRHLGGDMDSGFRRKDGGGPSGRGRGFRLSPERRGWAIGEGTWIPAFARKTGVGHPRITAVIRGGGGTKNGDRLYRSPQYLALTAVFDGGRWSASRSGRCPPGRP